MRRETFPYPADRGVIGIGLAMILYLVTCGLYGLVWQYRQMEILNAWRGRDEYDFWSWLLLMLITCGIYGLYYEYKMGNGISAIRHEEGLVVNPNFGMLSVLVAIFSGGLASMAIQQNEINELYGHNPDF